MNYIYTIILLLLISFESRSQTWNDWELIYVNDTTQNISNRFLDTEIEMLGGKKNAEKLFQQNIRFPSELKDTISKILNTNPVRIRVYFEIDTSGKVQKMNAWCSKYPFLTEPVKKALIYCPDFTPPAFQSKKVKTDIYYIFVLSKKEKIRTLKTTPFQFYIYPVYKDLPNTEK